MAFRRRVLDKQSTQSGLVRLVSGTVYNSTSKLGQYWICEDEVNDWHEDNSLLVDKRLRRAPVYNGEVRATYPPYALQKTVENITPYAIGNYSPIDPRSKFALPDFTQMTPLWILAMQPGKPEVNLPAILGEARELPSLITQIPELIMGLGMMRLGKNAGKAKAAANAAAQAARVSGSANLWYQFGLSPTVADILALLDILDDFIKALNDLLRLKNGRPLHRSLRLPPARILVDEGISTTHSAGIVITHRRTCVYKATSWVTSRWSALIPGLWAAALPDQLARDAMRQVLGLTLHGLVDAWWELLPWSWLTDWFARVQAFLGMGASLTLPLKLDSLCYMRTCFTDAYWAPVSCPVGVTFTGDGYTNRTVKERKVLSRTFTGSTPSLPALNGRRAGILASLLATR